MAHAAAQRPLVGIACAFSLAMSACLGGCASSEVSAQKDMGASVTPAAGADRSCQALRSEIMKLEARGVARLVDRQHDGGKLSAAQKAEIDSYNALLNEYLGARCHLN